MIFSKNSSSFHRNIDMNAHSIHVPWEFSRGDDSHDLLSHPSLLFWPFNFNIFSATAAWHLLSLDLSLNFHRGCLIRANLEPKSRHDDVVLCIIPLPRGAVTEIDFPGNVTPHFARRSSNAGGLSSCPFPRALLRAFPVPPPLFVRR